MGGASLLASGPSLPRFGFVFIQQIFDPVYWCTSDGCLKVAVLLLT